MEAFLEPLYQNQVGMTEEQSILWLVFLNYGLTFYCYLLFAAINKIKAKVNFNLLTLLSILTLATVTFYKNLDYLTVGLIAILFVITMFFSFRKLIIFPTVFAIIIACESVVMKLWVQPFDLLVSIFLLTIGLLACWMVVRPYYVRHINESSF